MITRYIFNDGTHQVNYETDGELKQHLSVKEFDIFAKESIKQHKHATKDMRLPT